MKNQSIAVSPYAITSELQAALDAVTAARAQCAKLADQVNAAAALTTTLEADITRITTERGLAEGALALCDDASEAKRHEKTIDRLTAELESKQRDLQRARTKVEALEGMAPDLDEAVKARGTELQQELGIWSDAAAHELAEEVAEAVKPLAVVMAKARALSGAGGGLADFLAATYVPNPEGFRRVYTSSGYVNQGVDLLAAGEAPQQAEADAIAVSLAAVKAGISAATYHQKYVPLAQRPKPYVRKGTEMISPRPYANRSAAGSPADTAVQQARQ